MTKLYVKQKSKKAYRDIVFTHPSVLGEEYPVVDYTTSIPMGLFYRRVL